MITLELGANQVLLVAGVVALLALGIGSIAWMFWRQHRQLQRSVVDLGSQVSVFAEASISVAQTVEQSLVVAPQSARHPNVGKSPAGRSELLQVAGRRLAQGQNPEAVQQALGLKDDELKLLCLAHLSNASAQTSGTVAPRGVPRAVA